MPAQVPWVADFPDSIFLNRIIVLNKDRETFLLTDSGVGVAYRLDGDTGKVYKVLEDPFTKPDSSASFDVGVSRIRLKGKTSELLFTNRNRKVAFISINDDGPA